MQRTFIAAAVSLALMVGAARLACAETPACDSPWSDVRKSADHNGLTVTDLPADQRDTVETAYNSAEPKSDNKFDHIYTVAAGEKIFIFLTTRGCVVHMARFTAEGFAHLLAGEPTI